jgi:HD superfamily phosphodiesterase
MNTVAPDLKLAYDFKHVDRVCGWAIQIAQNKGGEPFDLIEAAVLLHSRLTM